MKDAATLKDSRLIAIFDLYDLQTDLFRKAIDGIRDEDAHQRLGTKANHLAWIAGSTVESRFEGARSLGVDIQSKSHELFANHQGIREDVTYTSLQQYLADWDAVSPVLRERTRDADAGWLDTRIKMEGWEASNYELVIFMTYREANMIGQIALWRRLLGYPAMAYM
jgi:hypothetical protein